MLLYVRTHEHTYIQTRTCSLHDWALNRARASAAAKAEAEGRGTDAQRTRGGGITILAPPSADNHVHNAYRETHVQVGGVQDGGGGGGGGGGNGSGGTGHPSPEHGVDHFCRRM